MLLDTNTNTPQEHKAYQSVTKMPLTDGTNTVIFNSVTGQPIGDIAKRGKNKVDTKINRDIVTTEVEFLYAKSTVMKEDIQQTEGDKLVIPLLDDAVLNLLDKNIMTEAYKGSKATNLLEGLGKTGLHPVIYMKPSLFSENAIAVSQLGLLDNVVIDSEWFNAIEGVDALGIDPKSYRLLEESIKHVQEEVIDRNAVKMRAEKAVIGYMVNPDRAFYIGEIPTTTTTTTTTSTTTTSTTTTTTTETPTTTTTTTTEQPVAMSAKK